MYADLEVSAAERHETLSESWYQQVVSIDMPPIQHVEEFGKDHKNEWLISEKFCP